MNLLLCLIFYHLDAILKLSYYTYHEWILDFTDVVILSTGTDYNPYIHSTTNYFALVSLQILHRESLQYMRTFSPSFGLYGMQIKQLGCPSISSHS